MLLLLGPLAVFSTLSPAAAVGTNIGLGTAASYSVLGAEKVSNTGPSVLASDLGVAPGSELVGFPPGIVGGATHAGDAEATKARADLTTAYLNAAGQASDKSIGVELGGRTLTPGVYTASGSTEITGTLTLDAKGDPGAVFIFQVASSLTAASSSRVVLLNDAQSCHVFWQIGSSATVGTASRFVGTIMALTSITVKTGASVEGRALARNGAVTLDNNRFTDVKCATRSTAPPTSPAPTGTATRSSTSSASSSSSATASPTRSTPATRAPRTVSAASVTPTQSAAAGDLAFTGGGPSAPLIVVGMAAGLLGVALVVAARRRRVS